MNSFLFVEFLYTASAQFLSVIFPLQMLKRVLGESGESGEVREEDQQEPQRTHRPHSGPSALEGKHGRHRSWKGLITNVLFFVFRSTWRRISFTHSLLLLLLSPWRSELPARTVGGRHRRRLELGGRQSDERSDVKPLK